MNGFKARIYRLWVEDRVFKRVYGFHTREGVGGHLGRDILHGLVVGRLREEGGGDVDGGRLASDARAGGAEGHGAVRLCVGGAPLARDVRRGVRAHHAAAEAGPPDGEDRWQGRALWRKEEFTDRLLNPIPRWRGLVAKPCPAAEKEG